MTTISPNPHSPYATANPQHRHIFAVPIFWPTPEPGALVPTACEAMAVVGEDIYETRPGAELPDGMCPLCVAVMNGGPAPARPTSECGECGSGTWHGELCALCRQEKHEAWWPTRDTAPAAEEQPAACGKCKRPFDPADPRFDGHAQHRDTPWCHSCVDLCHESTDAFHRCVICDSYETGE